jgi:hypothetical protein
MKKSLIVVSFVFSSLFLIGFVSAGFLDNLFTGKAINGNAVWEITEPEGICISSWDFDSDADPDNHRGVGISSKNYQMFKEKNITLGSPEFNSWCLNIPSKSDCNTKLGCLWYGDNEISGEMYLNTGIYFNVYEGWNLLWGIHSPNQLVYSDNLNQRNIQSIYLLDPLTKEYLETYPDSYEFDQKFTYSGKTMADRGYVMKDDWVSFPSWVYFNKSGEVSYRLSFDSDDSLVNLGNLFEPGKDINSEFVDFRSQSYLIKGYNFLGLMPAFWAKVRPETNQFYVDDSFTLNEIKGSCNIVNAYYFENISSLESEWVPINLDEEIPHTKMLKAIAVKVEEDCVLSRESSEGFRCIEIDNSGTTTAANSLIKGTVQLYDGDGNLIQEKMDVCTNDFVLPTNPDNRDIELNRIITEWNDAKDGRKKYNETWSLIEYYCDYNIYGDPSIEIASIKSSNCNCVNGACIQ